jgi:hypothetical protein
MALDSRTALLMWIAARSGRTFRPDLSVDQMRAGYVRMNRSSASRTSPASTPAS